MRKFGQICFTVVPLLLSIGIQLLTTFFLLGVSALTIGIRYQANGSSAGSSLLSDINSLWAKTGFNASIMLVYAIFCVVVFGLWYYIKYNGNYLIKPKKVFHPLSLVGIVMLVPGCQFLTSYLISFLAALFPGWLEAYMELLEESGMNDTLSVCMLLYAIVIGPIAEELIYRGVTLHQAKKCLPFWAANILQALLFGIYHMNLMQGIYAFFVGLVLGYLCEKTGNIHNSILLHILFNLWGTLLSSYLTIGTSVFSMIFWFVFSILMTAGGLLLVSAGCRRMAHAPKAESAVSD